MRWNSCMRIPKVVQTMLEERSMSSRRSLLFRQPLSQLGKARHQILSLMETSTLPKWKTSLTQMWSKKAWIRSKSKWNKYKARLSPLSQIWSRNSKLCCCKMKQARGLYLLWLLRWRRQPGSSSMATSALFRATTRLESSLSRDSEKRLGGPFDYNQFQEDLRKMKVERLQIDRGFKSQALKRPDLSAAQCSTMQPISVTKRLITISVLVRLTSSLEVKL